MAVPSLLLLPLLLLRPAKECQKGSGGGSGGEAQRAPLPPIGGGGDCSAATVQHRCLTLTINVCTR